MIYGSQVGIKFNSDGSARDYPGNTVISDVLPGGAAFDVLSRARDELSRFGEYFAFLPAVSYHMTVIRGMNDLVRDPRYWPSALGLNCPIGEADALLTRAVSDAAPLRNLSMRFAGAVFTREDLRVRLAPANETCARELARFRDEIADGIGLRLPGHEGYTYHITLGYTLVMPENDAETALDAALGAINARLESEPAFSLSPPRTAFYKNMLNFSAARTADI